MPIKIEAGAKAYDAYEASANQAQFLKNHWIHVDGTISKKTRWGRFCQRICILWWIYSKICGISMTKAVLNLSKVDLNGLSFDKLCQYCKILKLSQAFLPQIKVAKKRAFIQDSLQLFSEGITFQPLLLKNCHSFEDPVFVISDGYTYEKKAFMVWGKYFPDPTERKIFPGTYRIRKDGTGKFLKIISNFAVKGIKNIQDLNSCAIAQDVVDDSHICLEDRHSYSPESLKQWVNSKKGVCESPITRDQFPQFHLYPNRIFYKDPAKVKYKAVTIGKLERAESVRLVAANQQLAVTRDDISIFLRFLRESFEDRFAGVDFEPLFAQQGPIAENIGLRALLSHGLSLLQQTYPGANPITIIRNLLEVNGPH